MPTAAITPSTIPTLDGESMGSGDAHGQSPLDRELGDFPFMLDVIPTIRRSVTSPPSKIDRAEEFLLRAGLTVGVDYNSGALLETRQHMWGSQTNPVGRTYCFKDQSDRDAMQEYINS